MDYIDDYKSCNRTYATLLIYPGEISADTVTHLLGLEPTRTSKAEDFPVKIVNGWFLSSKGHVQSKDSRRHIDYLLGLILPLKDKLEELKDTGACIEICCYWESASGNGGPTMSPPQMSILGELEIELWWDIWFSEHDSSV
ncbi:DUF4279 domain-containing protein [Vibrio parahaemolyticus]|nr:DUF4279 domain-containing protein [Vibrio parahaemolyticus]